MLTDLRLAIVGLGYWGPNLVRCAVDLESAEVKAICDRDSAALAKLARRYPGIGGTSDLDRLLDDPEIDGILIATPVSTHYEIAKRCLLAGKHVMVEKPLANTSRSARSCSHSPRSASSCSCQGTPSSTRRPS